MPRAAKTRSADAMPKHHVKEEEQRGGMFAQAKENADVPTPATRSMKGAALRRAAPVA